MSDATVTSKPRATSIPPTTHDEGGSISSGGEGEFDTSINRPDDMSGYAKEEISGELDAKSEGKQKRKRTSPQDQAILEAEYKQNPKPNKAARAEIVEKVSLNEKEVQIWFQNRRQINRRKSRPLLPHEIAAFGLGGMAALTSESSQYLGLSSSPSPQDPVPNSQADSTGSQEDEARSSQAPHHVEASEPSLPTDLRASQLHSSPPLLKRHSSSGLLESNSFTGSDTVIKSFTSTPGYLANRWNTANNSFSTPAPATHSSFVTPDPAQVSKPNSCGGRIELNKSSPNIRLSMSLDGKAELVSTSPSPPRVRPTPPVVFNPPPKRMRTLERSQSALQYPTPNIFVPLLARGRSRDARTWQICCDGDVRDELTAQAEREADGSAIAAISLIRSTSNSALQTSTSKRNAAPGKSQAETGAKPEIKPKLGRAQSSLARLRYTHKTHVQVGASEKDGLMRSPSGDSDKENWLPGENTGNSRRRPLPSARNDKLSTSRSVLGDNRDIPTHAYNLGGRSRKRKSADIGSSIFEDQENIPDDGGEEVQKFMRGEVSPSKKGDLDCIQGLLSLSQGNWR